MYSYLYDKFGLACLPVVHRWEGHRAAIQGLGGWRRQWDVLVVSTTQRSTLIGHHSSASAIMLTSSSGAVACSHLSGEDTGWRARVGVGVARVVHGVRVVMLIRTVTPTGDTESQMINTTEAILEFPVLDSGCQFSCGRSENPPVFWRHGTLRGSPPVSVNSVPMVWPQLFIQSHHVPLLPTVPGLPDFLHLPLQRSVHTAPLLLMDEDKLAFGLRYVSSCGLCCVCSLHLLLPLLFPLILRVLQHLLLPQVKEVRRVRVELEGLLVVVPAETQSL